MVARLTLVTNDSQSQSTNDIVTASPSMLKRHEDEVKKDQKLSPDPTLSRQQPMNSCTESPTQFLIPYSKRTHNNVS